MSAFFKSKVGRVLAPGGANKRMRKAMFNPIMFMRGEQQLGRQGDATNTVSNAATDGRVANAGGAGFKPTTPRSGATY